MTIKHCPDDAAAQHAGKRFLICFSLKICHYFVTAGKAANVQAFFICRPATKAGEIRCVSFLDTFFRHVEDRNLNSSIDGSRCSSRASDYNLDAHVFQLKRSRRIQVKKNYKGFSFLLALLLSTAFLLSAIPAEAMPQHGFSVKQYETFHDVLHPLEHEALPKNDFKRIRTKAGLLYSRGRAIVRLGVPAGTSAEQKTEFEKGLKTFSAALSKFRSDARRGTNAQLKTSYSAVHDSFEMLAGMLPRS